MAYSIEQQPDGMMGTGSPLIFTVYDDSRTGNNKFKYIADVYINGTASANKVARLKQLPNSTNRGIFDLSKIVDSYLYPTKVNQNSTTNSIHLLPTGSTSKPCSQNDSSLESVVVKFLVEYSSSATTAPVVYDSPTNDANTVYVFQASAPYGATQTNGMYNYANFRPDANTKRFLTNMPDYTIQGETINVTNDEWRTIAFWNGETAGS